MKKKLLTAVLALTMLLGLMPGTAWAAAGDTSTHSSHPICGATCSGHTNGDRHNESVTWTPWADTSTLPKRGNYYLTENVNLSSTFEIDNDTDLNLCLNGHIITGPEDDNTIKSSGGSAKLTICDCSGGGEVIGVIGTTAYDRYAINLISGFPTVNLYGGKITGGIPSTIQNTSGTLTIGGNAEVANQAKNAINNDTSRKLIITDHAKITSGGAYGLSNLSTCTLSGSPTISGATADLYLNTKSDVATADDSKVIATSYSGNALRVMESSSNKLKIDKKVGSYAIKVSEESKGKFTLTNQCYKYQYENGGMVIRENHSWASAWLSDASSHWHNCENADCPITENSGKNGYGDHTWGNSYETDGDMHWNTCTVCQTAGTKTNHTKVYDKDDTQHWQKCETCGWTGTKTAHDFTDDQDTICTTCGYQRTIALTGTVTVTGTAKVGETLTANYSGNAGTDSISYQWYRGDDPISDATESTYTLTSADIGKTIKVVVKGTGFDGEVSNATTVAVAKADQDAPKSNEGYTIDYTNETITIDNDCEVNTGADGLGTPVSSGSKLTPGQTVYIRKTETASQDPSPWTNITVPGRPAAPTEIGSVDETEAGKKDGKITGVTTDMEYSTDNGTTWTVCTGTEITGLGAGSYQVRTKAGENSFAGDSCTVTLKQPVTPSHTHQYGDTWTSDATNHWHQCTAADCPDLEGSVKESAEHTKIWVKTDPSQHWQTCEVCGWMGERTAHDFTDDQDTTCSICGYVRRIDLTGTVTITGTAKAGETLTATYTGNGTGISYQWFRGDDPISGATGNTYTLTDTDVGKTIKVKVTGTGFDGEVSSEATAAVAQGDQTAPTANEGYTINYTDETITIINGYEVNTSADGSGTPVSSGSKLTPGQTVYIRKTETASQDPSSWTDITVPGRPAAPTGIGSVDETEAGKKDGEITGVTADMEYSTDNGTTWTACSGTEITGLGAGSYQVRTKAGANSFAGEPYTVTLSAGQPVTPPHTHAWDTDWSHNETGHWHKCTAEGCTITDYSTCAEMGAAYAAHTPDGGTETKPATNTETGVKTYQCSVCGYVLRTEEIPVLTYSISGTVTEKDESQNDKPVEGVEVKLMQGNKQIGESVTTDAQGKYSFSGVNAGTYNVVAEKASGDGKLTKTILVVLTDKNATEQNVKMPDGKKNSVVEVKDNTPAVVVGGVDEVAEAETVTDGQTVTVKLTVEKKDNDADGANDIKTVASSKTVEFLDLSLTRQVNSENPQAITDTGNTVLEIVVSYDLSNKTGVIVYRHHGNSAEALEIAEGDTQKDGTFRLDETNGLIYIYASKFSTYAIGYTEINSGDTPVTPPDEEDKPDPSTPSSGGGSSSPATYSPIIEKSTHGEVEVKPGNPAQGDRVTVTLTPDKGYQIDSITVTDRNGRPVTVTDNGDGTYTFIQPNGKVTISASFKADGGYGSCPKDHTCPIARFPDISPTAWYHDGVHYCLEHGLMGGYDTGLFGPDDYLSRAQLVQMLYNQAGRPDVTEESSFEDVAPDAWYAKAVAWAQQSGIVSGYDNRHFYPDGRITREQLAVILWRHAGSPAATGPALDFTDADNVSGYAADALRWAVDQEIIYGKGSGILDPTGLATRAEAASMLMRYGTINIL